MSNSSWDRMPAQTAADLLGSSLPSNIVNSSLERVGTIVVGVWNGTAIADAYIASAATWNAKQAALVSGTNIKTVNGISLLGSGDISFLEVGGEIDILYPVNGTKIRTKYAVYPFDFVQLHQLELESGSLTLDVKINGVAVGGLNNLAVTTTPQSPTATSAYSVDVGDQVTFVISNASNPVGLTGSIAIRRRG